MLTPIRYLYRSVTENDRLSPRLATVFAFVAAALALLWHGARTPAVVLNGVIITAWPPEYIWSGLCLIIAGLLGLGKVVDAFTKVKLEAPPADNSTTIQTDSAAVSANTVNMTSATHDEETGATPVNQETGSSPAT